jgi:xylose isomerase
MSIEYSVITPFMGQLKDRFSHYHQPRTLHQKLELVTRIDGVTGVEIVYPGEFTAANEVKDLLSRHNLRVAAVNVDLKGDSRWHLGALTAGDEATRQEAVRWMQNGMDLAAELGSNLITMCPLADGHDYSFEVDYERTWHYFVDGIRAAADHRPDVRVSLEYKQSEPRVRVILGDVGKSLYACAEVDRPNVGVTVDVGHALFAGECAAESVALLASAGRLFHVHGNDNPRNWDWDLIPGFVNLWDLIEVTYYLRRAAYSGWVSFDVFPARLDPVRTMQTSLRMHRLAEAIIDQIGMDTLTDSIRQKGVLESMELFQSYLEGGLGGD